MKRSQTPKQQLLKVLFYVTAVIAVVTVLRGFFEGKPLNDYFWHEKVGEWIVKNKEVPTYGIYSWFAKDSGLYWFSHEWLSGVLIYLTSFGSLHAALVSAMVLQFLLLFLMMFRTRKYAEKNILVFSAFHIVSAYVLNKYFYPRPHLYSYFLLFFELAILYKVRHDEKNTKTVFFLPLIAVLWANLHGGSSNLSYILPIFVILTSLFPFSIGKVVFTKLPKEKMKNLLLATALCIFGLCVNPHGYKLLMYPLENMNDKLMLSAISEWAAPDIKTTSSFIAIIPVIIVALVFFLTKKDIHATDLLEFAFFTYLYLRSERFVALLIIGACFYMFDYVPELDIEKFFKLSSLIRKAVYALGLVLVLSYGISTVQKGLLSGGFPIQDNVVSEAAVEVIRARAPQRMYNHYNLGGELIYHDIDVFIDGRADMYSKYNFQDFMDMSYLKLDADGQMVTGSLIEKYRFDMFVCTTTDKMRLYLELHPDEYECIYQDEQVIIFVPC